MLAFGNHKPQYGPGSVLAIKVGYVPPTALAGDLQVSGIQARTFVWEDMRLVADPPYDGYKVDVLGSVIQGAAPVASYRGSGIALERLKGDKGFVSWVNDEKCSLFNPKAFQTNSLPRIELPETCARTFGPRAGESVKAVRATGHPVFEFDRFEDGKWFDSYVIWSTPAEAAAGRLDKVTVPRHG